MLETVLPVDSQPNAYSLVVVVVKQEIKQVLIDVKDKLGFPSGISGKEPSCQCRRHKRQGFNPWLGKVPWGKVWQPTPVFLPGESHGQRSLVGYSPFWVAKSQIQLKRLSTYTKINYQ